MMRRSTRLLSVAGGLTETCAVEFHKAWMAAAFPKLLGDVGDLQGKVDGVKVEAPTAEDDKASVAAEVGPCEDFHAKWMDAVHRKVVRQVDERLAEQVEEMKEEEISFLAYPPAINEDKKGKVIPNTTPVTGRAKDLPPALHMWVPGKKHSHNITWRLGMEDERRSVGGLRRYKRRKHDRTTFQAPNTMDYLVMTQNKNNKSPWTLPPQYKTMPIPNMHLSGFGPGAFQTMMTTTPVSLRLMLFDEHEGEGAEGFKNREKVLEILAKLKEA